MPRDIAKLVQSASGNLLTVNEQTLAVHYVHHTLLSHLQETKSIPSNYHFNAEDSLTTVMEICITYLNYDIFGNQLVRRRPLELSANPASVPEQVIKTAISNTPLPAPVSRLLSRKRMLITREISMDIWKIMDEARIRAMRQEKQYTLHTFFAYAQENWLQHSKSITADSSPVYYLWLNIVRGQVNSLQLPWTDLKMEGLEWAYLNSHSAILALFFSYSDPLNPFDLGPDNVFKLSLLCDSPEARAPNVKDIVARVVSLGIRREGAVSNWLGSTRRRAIQRIIEISPDIDEPLSDQSSPDIGMTPLALVCQDQRWGELLVDLLEKGADPSLASGKFHETPLLIATRMGWQEGVRLLLEYSADPNKGSPTLTPLGQAIIDVQHPIDWEGSIIEKLLFAGASPFLPAQRSPMRRLLGQSMLDEQDMDLACRILLRCRPLIAPNQAHEDSLAEARQVLSMLEHRECNPKLAEDSLAEARQVLSVLEHRECHPKLATIIALLKSVEVHRHLIDSKTSRTT
jgi:hypothetical protein